MRLSLSDDPEAVKMKEQIMDSALMMGLPKGTDMNTLFTNMTKMISLMRDRALTLATCLDMITKYTKASNTYKHNESYVFRKSQKAVLPRFSDL